MNIRKSEIAIVGIVLFSTIVSVCFYPQMPEKMATHWNAQGQVDGYMSKLWGLFFMPLVLAGIALLAAAIPRIDPLKCNIEKFRKYYDGFIILLLILMLAIQFQVILWNLGIEISPTVMVPIGLGLLFFYIGILCENSKRNWFIGIRTPWTLSDERVWEKTHKIGGKLFKIAGLVIFASVFFQSYIIFFILVPTLFVVAYTTVYSYFEYEKVGKTGEPIQPYQEKSLQANSGNNTWDTLKAEYLRRVEKTLSSVKSPRSKEVLEDVRAHLDRRFAELGPEQQTWENFQAIITDMGPASDYAELLDSHAPPSRQRVQRKYLFWFSLAAVIMAFAILLPLAISGKLWKSRIVDKIDYPFVNDPEVVGRWQSVDFVKKVEDFKARVKHWRGDLYLKEMIFFEDGRTKGPWTWTKGLIIHPGDKTAAKYHIKEINGSTYMFFEWKSGDYTIRHMKPWYYVLRELFDKDTIAKETTPETQQDVINAAIDSAHAWLKLVDEGAYDQSWEQSAGYFKKAVSREQLQKSFDAVRRPLGKVISRRVKSKRYTKQAPGAPDGQYVIIQFETSFENKTSAVETVTPMLDKDGQWRVSGYYIK